MKSRLIFWIVFWIVAAPLWCVSGVIAMFCLLFFLDAPNQALVNQQEKAALYKRVQWVEDYLKSNGRLPSDEEFAKASTNLDNHSIYDFELRASRPSAVEGAETFNFPEWPKGKQNYAIGYWRGEWTEFYDSNTRSTTLDETSTVGCWRRAALRPLRWSAAFGIPPFILLWFLKKKAPAKS